MPGRIYRAVPESASQRWLRSLLRTISCSFGRGRRGNATKSPGVLECGSRAFCVETLIGPATVQSDWRGIGDPIAVTVCGDDPHLFEPSLSLPSVRWRIAKRGRPWFAGRRLSLGDRHGAVFDESLAFVECGTHVRGHLSVRFGDESGDEAWSCSSATASGAGGGSALEALPEDRTDVIRVAQVACGDQSGEEGVEVVAVGVGSTELRHEWTKLLAAMPNCPQAATELPTDGQQNCPLVAMRSAHFYF
jgi:hypothetical protein